MSEGRERDFAQDGNELPPDFPDVPIDAWDKGEVRVFDGENEKGERVCMVQYFDEEGSVERYSIFIKKEGIWRLDQFSKSSPPETAALREVTEQLRDILGTTPKKREREAEAQ